MARMYSMFCQRLQRWFRIGVMLAVFIGAAGCLEMKIDMTLRQDGSGSVQLNYVIIKAFLSGKYAEVEQNDLVPMTAADAEAWAAQIDGLKLIDVRQEDHDEGQYAQGGVRQMSISAVFDDVEAIAFDHVRFAFYPYRGRKIFQFAIEKALNEEAAGGANQPVNLFADLASKGRNVRLNVEFPGRVLDSNADESEWGNAQWTIPLQTIVSTPQPRVVAWAATPVPDAQRVAAWFNPMWFWVRGAQWRSPEALPDAVVWPEYDPRGGQTPPRPSDDKF